MKRLVFFLLLIGPSVTAQTRCDTLAHDIEIYWQIAEVQTRTIHDLQKQVMDLKMGSTLAQQAITDLEVRANREIAQLKIQYAGYVKPPTRWERIRKEASAFAAGAGVGMIIAFIFR